MSQVFYHICVEAGKGVDFKSEFRFDLSKEALISKFIEPYEQGSFIMINGVCISPEDLVRIRVFQTSVDLKSLLKHQGEKFTYDHIKNTAEDVTDEIIKGPPGYKKSEIKENKSILQSDRVFIVHGHDQLLENSLEIFLKEIGLNPIVLHRKPDEGLTILEKFEKHSNAAYAFILLTPDDIGYPEEEHQEKEKDSKIEHRARQNVIFEFGYFVGKLGRDRVCCIYKEGTTLPTDVSGLLYKKVRTSIEEVGYSLIKELTAAGYKLDISPRDDRKHK